MTSFFELLQIYKWSLAATIVTAGALSLIGSQWTAREKSSQIFVLGQGSSLGIILGLALNILFDYHSHSLSLILGFSVGWMTLVLSDLLIRTKSDRNHIYLTLFVIFMAISYLITSLVPSLETHVASSYFGDISVMSDTAAIVGLILSAIFSLFLLRRWRQITLASFRQVNESEILRDSKSHLLDLATLLITTLAVQNMGYLFAMGSLFIGTTFAALHSQNLQKYTRKMLWISYVGSFLGFLTSLLSTNLPTVPCVLIGQFVVGLIIYTKK